MKKIFLLLFLGAFIFSCSDSEDLALSETPIGNTQLSERLNFANEENLRIAIESSNFLDETSTRSSSNQNFASLMSKVTSDDLRNAKDDNNLTYYEALGYDSLIPNPNFAALFTPKGELEVGENVVKVTSNGTYIFSLKFEQESLMFIDENPDFLGQSIGDGVYQVNEKIVLYRTFQEQANDYAILSDADYEVLPDDYFGDDEPEVLAKINTKAVSEPDFNSFQTFSADRKTWFGKLIQSLIGSTKTSTIKFNKKRRVRGSFYFYNYGVYAEIGVKGWTDKKNWIGWSKTKSDELRVGWKNIVLKKSVPDYYKQSLKSLNNIIYYPPQYVEMNGKRVNVATLAMPDFKPNLKDRILSQGTKAIYDYLKNELKRPPTEWEKAQGFIVATRTELYYVTGTENVKKYNTKYYCHVFSNSWMDFSIGWNNSNGIIINGMNQNNVNKIGDWGKTILKAYNEKKPKLESGEVYICARLGNEWRGMKIIKK